MTLLELFNLLLSNNVWQKAGLLGVLAIIVLSVIQVSKIPANPWSWLARKFGRAINGELFKKIDDLEKKFDDAEKERQADSVSNMRWFILSFAQSCRNGEKHDKEQWSHALNEAKRYEAYTRKRKIENGVIEEDTKFIRNLYLELSREHKI